MTFPKSCECLIYATEAVCGCVPGLRGLVLHLEKIQPPLAQASIDVKITEILRVVDEIQNHSKPVIEHCYREFLLQNSDPDEREYPEPEDQIREVLIHGNYLSQRDIEICLSFDLDTFVPLPEYQNMRELHDALVATWGTPNI